MFDFVWAFLFLKKQTKKKNQDLAVIKMFLCFCCQI